MTLEGVLTTTGVNSEVLDNEEYTLGHILLCDYDDGIGTTYDQMFSEIINLDGITVLLKSSKDSYHVWNLTIRSIENLLKVKAELHDDPKHLCIGYRRGRWALRVSAKYEPQGDKYKDAPQILRVFTNDTDLVQSKPHVKLLEALCKRQDYDLSWRDHIPTLNLVGSAAPTEDYLTMVDDLKTFGDNE